MRKFIIILLILAALTGSAGAIEVLDESALSIPAPSAILMEKISGQVIYEKDAHTQRAPASVTKVMSLLLVMEEIEAGRLSEDDIVICSAFAASMGGSQIWLEEGEKMSVHDMLKAVCVVSANDCTVALAEHISGSEEGFVRRMNERANELGMENTHFTDCTGLTDDSEHFTTAYDIALMSRELIMHERIKDFSTIWMDSLREGKSELTNTNKLVRFYEGTTGLKTGFTTRAMYCLTSTAMRNNTEYIAVVMYCQSSTDRFESAKALLNFAFANYAVCPLRSPQALPPVPVKLGLSASVQPEYSGKEGMLIEKARLQELNYEFLLPESVAAPVTKGDKLGEMIVSSGENELARVELFAGDTVEKLTVFKIYGRMLSRLFGG